MSWLVAVAASGLYVWAAATRTGGWPPQRTVVWLGGLTVLVVALNSGLDSAAEEKLSAHMVQHGLISLVAAPLLVAAAPVRLALATLPRSTARTLARTLHARALRGLVHPVAGLTVFVTVLVGIHLPAIYVLALRNPTVHAVEHAALFWTAVALWAPLIAADPIPRRLGAVGTITILVAAMSAMGAIGAAVSGAGHVLYAPYATAAPGALADQELAGGIMWIGGMAVVLPTLLVLAWRALAAEERRQRVRDRRALAVPENR